MFWWSFSCSSMKLSYRSCVKAMSLNTAATAYGRTAAVCPQHKHSLWSNRFWVATKSSSRHRQRHVTTHVLRNNQPLRLPTGRADASVARSLHPATQESLWSFKCNITDTVIHKTWVTALFIRGFHWKIVLTYFWRPASHGPTPPDIKGHSD